MPALLPWGIKQFCDGNGNPLTSGWVAYAQVGTGGATLRNVYGDEGETVLLQNPVPLDASGRPYSGGSQQSIWGDGAYEEYVYDSQGVLQTTSIIDTQSSPATAASATGAGASIGAEVPRTETDLGPRSRILRQHQSLSTGLGFAITQGGLGSTNDNGVGEVEFDAPFTALGTIVCTYYDPDGHNHGLAPLTIKDFSASGFKVEVKRSHPSDWVGLRRDFFWLAAGA